MKAQSTYAAAEREFVAAYTPHEHEELRALARRPKAVPATPQIVSTAHSTRTLR